MRFVPLVTTLVYAAAGVAAGQHEGAQVISCTHKPLTTPAVAPVEVFVFDPPTNETDWSQMDWEQITTLALFGPWPPPEDLYCHAHAHNVKIVKCVVSSQRGISETMRVRSHSTPYSRPAVAPILRTSKCTSKLRPGAVHCSPSAGF